MAKAQDRTKWREGLLLVGFLLVLALGVWTVVVPELGKDAAPDAPKSAPASP